MSRENSWMYSNQQYFQDEYYDISNISSMKHQGEIIIFPFVKLPTILHLINNYILSCESDGSNNSCDDESKICVSANGKNLSLMEDSILDLEMIQSLNVNENFKDAMLASLYAQVDFLKNELEEKNLLIRTLIIQESQVYDIEIENSVQNKKEISNTNSLQDDTKSESRISLDDLPATDDNCNDSMINMDFKEVYNIYQKDKSDNLMCQCIRENKHEKYISDREKVQDASNVCQTIEKF